MNLPDDAPRCDINISKHRVTINGREVVVPDDAKIHVHPVGWKDLVRVDLTVYATSVKIG